MKKYISHILGYMRPGRRAVVAASLGLALGISVIIIFLKTSGKGAEASAWMDDNWLYRTAYNITNSSSAINAERKIKLDIDTAALITAGKMQSDCDDARFTDATGKQLDYFIDTDTGACNTNSTDFYIKVPAVIAGKQTIFFYYGNSTAPRTRKNDFFAPDTTGQGLKAYFPMDEASANTCTGGSNDTCDYALTNDGAWGGNTINTTGKINNGVLVDGSGDYIDISNNINYATNAVTASAWIYVDESTTARQTIISSKENSNGGFVLHIGEGSTNKAGLYIQNSTTWARAVGTTQLQTNTWYHVLGTYDGTNIKIYVNGNLENTTAHAGTLANQVSSTTIGARNSTFQNEYQGTIDDVRIYNRALSGSEISAIYNSGNGQSLSVPLTFTQSATAAASEEQSPGPVAAWSFDEGQGTTAYDSTSNSNNGTLTNGPVWKNESDCISGKCLYFDGSNDYISVADNSLLNPINNSFTASVWLRPNGLQAAQTGIFSKNNGDYYIFEINSSNLIAYEIRDNSGAGNYFSGNGNNSLNNNQWNHVSWVLDRTNQNIYLYLNGKLDKTISISTMDEDINPSGGALNIGRHTGYFKGSIDEPRIYPYARTAAQIRADYAARGTSQGVEAQIGDNGAVDQLSNGLVAYYPMDESAANTCTGGVNDTCDRSGNNNDGAWNGNATTTTGKYGNGTTFDGSGDYISAGTNPSNLAFQKTNSFSTSAWIYPVTGMSNFSAIMQNQSSSTFAGWNFSIYDNDGLSAVLASSGTDKYYVYVDQGLTLNAWNHVIATYDGSGSASGIKIFINGTMKTLIIGDNDVGSSIDYTTSTSEIGRRSFSELYFNGSLDEVRIYNRALSPAEVSALYNWAPGPVAHWKLDENTGTSATDTSGNSNTGTLTNGPVWAQGKFGNAVKFDGTNDYIQIPDSTSLNFVSRPFSIGVWVNKSSSVGSDSRRIFDKSQAGTGNGYALDINDTNIRLIGTNNFDTTYTFANNTWYYLTSTWDGTTARLFVNGTQLASSTSYSNSNSYTGTAQIAKASDSSAYFPGKIDDVRVYNYALTQRQIANIMNGQDVNAAAVGSPVGHPVAHWSFDEGYGTTAQDKSINNNAGTLTNMASPATATSGWSNNGKFGKAVQFDGSNDYVSIPHTSTLNPASDYTISAWVNPSSIKSQGIIRKMEDNSNVGYRMTLRSDGTIWCDVGTANISTGLAPNTVTYSTNTWQQIVCVRVGSTISMYINGKLKATNSVSTSAISTSTDLIIANNVSEYFSGLLDEVKIYNYALSQDEVNLEYNRGAATVFGSTSTASDGVTADNSAGREYCVPGDTSSCAAPVAEWKLDEGTGTTGNDTSGNGNTGTLTNGPTWTNGKFGKAVSFDGSNDYVAVGTSFSDSIESTGSISAWAYRTGIGGTLFNRSTGTSWTDERLVLAYFRSDTSTWGWAMSNGTNYQNPEWAISTFPSNEWVHLAINWNGTTVNTYLNGSLFDSRAQQYTPEITGIDTWIGRTQGLGNGYFPGKIDNIRIYNYARTPAQIAWEYNRGAPVAHYKLDECQGTTAYNAALSGNGQAAGSNGTISIGATGTNTSAGTCTGSAGEAWKDGATGKLGASLEFDGSDDYVEISNPDIIGTVTNFSIAVWIKTSKNSSAIFGEFTNNGDFTRNFLSTSSSGKAQFDQYSPSGGVFISNKTIADGTWHHVIYTQIGTLRALYIDGALDITDNSAETYTGTSPSASRIGYRGSNQTSYTFNGQIDDVRIYNYALTPVQVRDVYNGGAVSFK